MAKSETPAFDDLEPVDATDSDEYSDDDGEWLDLERGESVVGEIRGVTPNCGDYDTTVLELAVGIGEVKPMWSNRQIDRALESKDLEEGDVIGIKHTEEEQSFKPDDSDEFVTFDVWEVRAVSDN